MSCTATDIVLSGLLETEIAVYGQVHLVCIRILLAVIFPPADGTESQCIGYIQCLQSTTWTTKLSPQDTSTRLIDEMKVLVGYMRGYLYAQLLPTCRSRSKHHKS